MIKPEFVEGLVDIAQEQGSDAQLVSMRDQAMAAIAAGGGEVPFLTNAGQNGKSGQQECRMDAAELLANVTLALRRYRETEVTLTYTDFSILT